MRQSFSCPAAYRRYVVAQIALAADDVVRDADYRSDDDERVRQFAKVPDALYDGHLRGVVTITVDDAVALPASAEAVEVARATYIAVEQSWRSGRGQIIEHEPAEEVAEGVGA